MAYVSLFLTAFASATLLPGGSEALFLYLLSENTNPLVLLGIATCGNTLGSFVNYLLGKYGMGFALKYHYVKEKSLSKASTYFETYGAWSLLFSWLPIIGDPLTLFAGIARYSWWDVLNVLGTFLFILVF